MEGWFDSHCHLQDQYRGEADLTDALARAREAGVNRLVCVGTDAASSEEALRMARPEQGLWATAGQHPHEASAGTAAVAELIESTLAAGSPALVAVGECGLDYHYEHSPRDAQRRAFAEQIALAHHHRLALVIHAREAWDDLFDVLAAEGVPGRAVLHCFTGGVDEMRRCVDAGMFVSFSGIVTFKNASDVRDAARECPLDRLLVETDAPFLAPVPHRGKTNEPALVHFVGEAIAELRGMDPAELAASSASAASRAFGV